MFSLYRFSLCHLLVLYFWTRSVVFAFDKPFFANASWLPALNVSGRHTATISANTSASKAATAVSQIVTANTTSAGFLTSANSSESVITLVNISTLWSNGTHSGNASKSTNSATFWGNATLAQNTSLTVLSASPEPTAVGTSIPISFTALANLNQIPLSVSNNLGPGFSPPSATYQSRYR